MRLRLASILLCALAAPAVAAPYEAFIDVETLEDLDDLLANQQIDPETHAALSDLLERGVDLDRATRQELYSLPNLTYDDVDAILEYRSLNRFIANPADLVAAGALTEQKLLAISAFLVQIDRSRGPYAPRGHVTARTRAVQTDRDPPPLALRARVSFGRRITAGAAATLGRLRIGDVRWDETRDAFIADRPSPRPYLPKAFVRYRGERFDVIAGTYRIGFGERLTFDNTTDYTPDGIYVDDVINNESGELTLACKESNGETEATCEEGRRTSRDYGWSDGLLGVAAGLPQLALGTGWAKAYAWGSFQPRDLYQYHVMDRDDPVCAADPRDPDCDAPAIYLVDGDRFLPAARASYQTVTNAYAEALAGAHVGYHAARRDFVGLTAYGAMTRWLIDTPSTVELDFQEFASTPIGGRYGAVGVNAGLGRGDYDLFAEVTRTFDRIPALIDPDATVRNDSELDGGGGFGAVVRATRSERKRELEVSLRYYDPDFVNPRGGPIADSDQLEGQRARGEHGVQVRYTGVHDALAVRARVGVHRAIAKLPHPEDLTDTRALDEYVPKLAIDTSATLTASKQLAYTLRVQWTEKDLRGNGSVPCYEGEFDSDRLFGDEDDACKGMRLRTTARVRVLPERRGRVLLTGELNHAWFDDGVTDDPSRRRHDLGAVVSATWKPRPGLRVKARVRYQDESVDLRDEDETTLWSYVELFARTRDRDSLTVRADLFSWLDRRESTLEERDPRHEVRGSLVYQARF